MCCFFHLNNNNNTIPQYEHNHSLLCFFLDLQRQHNHATLIKTTVCFDTPPNQQCQHNAITQIQSQIVEFLCKPMISIQCFSINATTSFYFYSDQQWLQLLIVLSQSWPRMITQTCQTNTSTKFIFMLPWPPYSDCGGLLYSCFDDVWDNWCILDYSLILWGATSKGSSTIIKILHSSVITIRTSCW